MAFEEETWQSVITPFVKGVSGSLMSSFDDLPWLEDQYRLDPFSTQFDADVERLTAPVVGTRSSRRPTTFSLPTAATKGEATADRIAADKGVDPGPNTRGVGNMIDLAKTMLGVPYVFGAGGLSAFDCSGFTKWLYSRALGVALPHQSTQQASSLDKIGRDDLQPGDLVFFSYGRLGAGVVDHVEVYMGDGKMIGTANTTDDLDIDSVDWDNFVQGGRAPGAAGAVGAPTTRNASRAPARGVSGGRAPVAQSPELAPMSLSSGPPAMAAVMDALFAPDSVPVSTTKTPRFRGQTGSISKQLYRGFIDAGRPDLARMVGTKEFEAWVRAESGYRPDVVSQHFEGHGVNYGLFQFWEGHEWTQEFVEGGSFTASPYDQAKLVAKYFSHLTPAKIREYAEQIRAGSYSGWG